MRKGAKKRNTENSNKRTAEKKQNGVEQNGPEFQLTRTRRSGRTGNTENTNKQTAEKKQKGVGQNGPDFQLAKTREGAKKGNTENTNKQTAEKKQNGAEQNGPKFKWRPVQIDTKFFDTVNTHMYPRIEVNEFLNKKEASVVKCRDGDDLERLGIADKVGYVQLGNPQDNIPAQHVDALYCAHVVACFNCLETFYYHFDERLVAAVKSHKCGEPQQNIIYAKGSNNEPVRSYSPVIEENVQAINPISLPKYLGKINVKTEVGLSEYSLSTLFNMFYTNILFTDMIVCCDSQFIVCHRVLLCAYSAYFEEVVDQIRPGTDSIVYIDNLQFWQLETLVKFMYTCKLETEEDKYGALSNAVDVLKFRRCLIPLELICYRLKKTLLHDREVSRSYTDSAMNPSQQDKPNTSTGGSVRNPGYHTDNRGSTSLQNQPSTSRQGLIRNPGYHTEGRGSSSLQNQPSTSRQGLTQISYCYTDSTGNPMWQDEPSTSKGGSVRDPGYHSEDRGSTNLQNQPSTSRQGLTSGSTASEGADRGDGFILQVINTDAGYLDDQFHKNALSVRFPVNNVQEWLNKKIANIVQTVSTVSLLYELGVSDKVSYVEMEELDRTECRYNRKVLFYNVAACRKCEKVFSYSTRQEILNVVQMHKCPPPQNTDKIIEEITIDDDVVDLEKKNAETLIELCNNLDKRFIQAQVCDLYNYNVLLFMNEFYKTGRFVDTTLICKEQKIKCHRFVLSTFSAFFQGTFCESCTDHCAVTIEGLEYWQVKAAIDFMYTCRIGIQESEWCSLMEALDKFELRDYLRPDDLSQNTANKRVRTMSNSQ